jgi:hypothetical protein
MGVGGRRHLEYAAFMVVISMKTGIQFFHPAIFFTLGYRKGEVFSRKKVILFF